MNGVSAFKEALETKSLTALTKALSELAEGLAYHLKPPYTEILDFKAKEEGSQFAVHFEARLHLHYSNLGNNPEGLIFTIKFGGDALSDSPTPPIHELFYAGVAECLRVYGYGSKWKGTTITTPEEFMKNPEVASKTISLIDIDRLYQPLDSN
jgi:hypothetical protein